MYVQRRAAEIIRRWARAEMHLKAKTYSSCFPSTALKLQVTIQTPLISTKIELLSSHSLDGDDSDTEREKTTNRTRNSRKATPSLTPSSTYSSGFAEVKPISTLVHPTDVTAADTRWTGRGVGHGIQCLDCSLERTGNSAAIRPRGGQPSLRVPVPRM